MAADRLALFKAHYGFDFPADLAESFAVLKRLRPLEPLLALKDPLGLYLVGPFELLAGRFDRIVPRPEMLLHWRFCNDAPEFFTVMVRAQDDVHWGYWIDQPGRNTGQPCWTWADPLTPKIKPPVVGSILAAVRSILEEKQAIVEEAQLADLALPQDAEVLASLAKLREKVGRHATHCPAWEIPEVGSAYLEKIAVSKKEKGTVQARKAPVRTKAPKDFAVALSTLDEAMAEGDWEKAGRLRADLWARTRPSRQVALLQRCEQYYRGLKEPILAKICALGITHHQRKWVDLGDAELPAAE